MKLLQKILFGIAALLFLLACIDNIHKYFFKGPAVTVGGTYCFPTQGCTGTSTAPSYGQVLVGNAGATYTLTATSSLGISGNTGSGTTGQFPYYAANGTTLTATSSLYLATSGNVGVGTTNPAANLEIAAGGVYVSNYAGGVNVPGGGTLGMYLRGPASMSPFGFSAAGSGSISASAPLFYYSWTDSSPLKLAFSTFDGGSVKNFINLDYVTGNTGIGSTSPFAKFSLGSGSIVVPENTLATSTSMTVSFLTSTQQLVRIGTAATTISFSNYLTGSILRLITCNPNNTAGAITFSGVRYSGGVQPGNTTTANQCDLWSFIATNGTSTPILVLTGMIPGIQ